MTNNYLIGSIAYLTFYTDKLATAATYFQVYYMFYASSTFNFEVYGPNFSQTSLSILIPKTSFKYGNAWWKTST